MKTVLVLAIFLASFLNASQSSTYTYVQVYKTQPIYEYRIKKQYEQCEEPKKQSSSFENSVGIDTIIGATLGVAIGNQIGKGNGKDVAKVVGGIVGATMANNTRDYRNGNNSYNNCDEAYYTTSQEEVLVGYKNYFVYDNQTYTKVTKSPRRQIKVTKTINF
ncbi:MAG: glycine zipper 2TM domain-containing protein [Campylobacterota bacterium]